MEARIPGTERVEDGCNGGEISQNGARENEERPDHIDLSERASHSLSLQNDSIREILAYLHDDVEVESEYSLGGIFPYAESPRPPFPAPLANDRVIEDEEDFLRWIEMLEERHDLDPFLHGIHTMVSLFLANERIEYGDGRSSFLLRRDDRAGR